MSDLLVIEFPTEAQADEVRQKLLTMQSEYLIELGDAAVVTKVPRTPDHREADWACP
jgi:uncharacterized membrane protein